MRFFLLAVLAGMFVPVLVRAENFCALTFDDGPSKYTERLLDSLARRGVPATFFVLGENAARFPGTIRRALAMGFEVGNHSWSHPNLHELTVAEQEKEIKSTSDLLRSLGGKPKYFRPPYGNSDEGVLLALEKEGMTEIFWTVDSRDWQQRPQDYARLTDGRGNPFPPGGMHGIFLFHDIQKHTVDDIDRIIDGLAEAGCETFVTVSDYLDRADRRQRAGITGARNAKKKRKEAPEAPPPPVPGNEEFFAHLPLLPSH